MNRRKDSDMRTTATFLMLLAAVLVIGCGTSTAPDVSGNWTGTTTSTQGGTSVTFTFTMQEGASNGNTVPVTFSSLSFTTQNNCFDNSATITGTITPGSPRTMAIDIFSLPNNAGNHSAINLTIAPDNNSATGTYVLTGGSNGCTNDQGNLTITRA